MLRKLFGLRQAAHTPAAATADMPDDTPPKATFDEKMYKYAAQGRNDVMPDSMPILAALKPAVKAGDIAFLREAAAQYPDVFARNDYWVTKEAVNAAIEYRHPDIVRFFLQDIKISPDCEYPESDKLPQWDALLVAAIGHEPYTLSAMAANYKTVAGQDIALAVDEEIFDIVIDAYKDKYQGNAGRLAKALTRQFSMPTGKTFWNSSDYQDYRVQSTSRSYGSALSMAQSESFKDKIRGALREIERDLDDVSRMSIKASMILD